MKPYTVYLDSHNYPAWWVRFVDLYWDGFLSEYQVNALFRELDVKAIAVGRYQIYKIEFDSEAEYTMFVLKWG